MWVIISKNLIPTLYILKNKMLTRVCITLLFFFFFFWGNLQFQQTVRFEAKKGAPIMKIYIYIYIYTNTHCA